VLYRNDEVLIHDVHQVEPHFEDHYHDGVEDTEVEVYHAHEEHDGHEHSVLGGIHGGVLVKKPLAVVLKETTCYHFDQLITVSEQIINRMPLQSIQWATVLRFLRDLRIGLDFGQEANPPRRRYLSVRC
jgi:hypothetical protein